MHRIYKVYQEKDRIVLKRNDDGRQPENIDLLRLDYGGLQESIEVTLERAMDLLRKKGQKIINVSFCEVTMEEGFLLAKFVTHEDKVY